MPKANTKEKIWEKIDVKGTDECWNWKPNCSNRYAHFWYQGKKHYAHRFVYMITNNIEEIPIGFCVCHKCDNTKCCNPGHLFLGTHQENMNDREEKHRNKIPDNRGANNGMFGKIPWNKGIKTKEIIGTKVSQALIGRFGGENCPNSKLNWEQVREIRKLYNLGKISLRELAKMFNISKTNILSIIHNKTWKE